MTDTQAFLTDFMAGYARHNRAGAQAAAQATDWAELAQRVLEEERRQLLRSLGIEALADIAAGRADLAAAARAALAAPTG